MSPFVQLQKRLLISICFLLTLTITCNLLYSFKNDYSPFNRELFGYITEDQISPFRTTEVAAAAATTTRTTPISIITTYSESQDLPYSSFIPELNYTPYVKCSSTLWPLGDYDGDQEADVKKYITYLPHSGFHNQRIALENALFLAWYTNRTLVLPPMILGSFKVPWTRRSELITLLSQLKPDKDISICQTYKNMASFERCIKKLDYTLLPWSYLYNTTFVKRNVEIIEQNGFNQSQLYKLANIKNPKNDVYVMEEDADERYGIQWYDDPDHPDITIPNGKFKQRMEMCFLRRKEKLIYLSSLFGSRRLITTLERSKEFRTALSMEFIFGNQVLLDVADRVAQLLGDQYLGLHLRLGDGSFKERKNLTVADAIEAISKIEPLSEVSFANGKGSLAAECQNHVKNTNNETRKDIVFIAMDAMPSDPVLKPLFKKFPCTFILSNFSSILKPLDRLVNPNDGSSLGKLCLPMVDLIIAAKGTKTFGTVGSTFSSYAMRLHQLWFRK